jgi:hypothetical protein
VFTQNFHLGINELYKGAFMGNRYIVLLIFLFIAWSCQKDSPVTESNARPAIEGISMAEKWNVTSKQKKKIEVKVNMAEVAVVLLTVKRVQQEVILFQDSLYDDAGYYYPEDGDVVAGDGYFSNRYLASEIVPEVEEKVTCVFDFKVISTSGKQSASFETNVEFLRDALPAIVSVSSPDSIKSAVPQVVFRVTAIDSDGIAQIRSVYFEGRAPGSRIMLFRDTLAFLERSMYQDMETAVYQAVRDSSFGAGKIGYYDLHFYVQDDLEELNEKVPVSQIFIENKSGSVWDSRLPGEVERPMKFPVEAMVSDPQGLQDIDAVYFQTVKPDGTFGSNGAFFDMRDTGEEYYGDQEAGDGIYSKYIQVEENNDPGKYYFHFYMRDKAGHLSEMKLDSIRVQ